MAYVRLRWRRVAAKQDSLSMASSPAPACCSLYPATETSYFEVVGRGGNEQFGLRRAGHWQAVCAEVASRRADASAVMGPAARGRRCRWAGAQPCSSTPPSMRTAQSAAVGGGSEVPWPRPRCWRPAPRGTVWPAVIAGIIVVVPFLDTWPVPGLVTAWEL